MYIYSYISRIVFFKTLGICWPLTDIEELYNPSKQIWSVANVDAYRSTTLSLLILRTKDELLPTLHPLQSHHPKIEKIHTTTVVERQTISQDLELSIVTQLLSDLLSPHQQLWLTWVRVQRFIFSHTALPLTMILLANPISKSSRPRFSLAKRFNPTRIPSPAYDPKDGNHHVSTPVLPSQNKPKEVRCC